MRFYWNRDGDADDPGDRSACEPADYWKKARWICLEKIDSIQYSDVSKGKGSQGGVAAGAAVLNNEQCADRTSGAAVWTGGALWLLYAAGV